MIKNKTGVWGELFAVRYLRNNDYKILTTNYISRFGEVDIIAEKNNVVCFVEVKTRTDDPLFRPADAVDESKQEKIKSTSEQFLARFGMQNNARFDVCEVWLNDEMKLSKLNYIENAF